jgi:hypothetical protein
MLLPHSWVQESVEQVRRRGEHNGKSDDDYHRSLSQRNVTVQDAVEQQPSHARYGKNDLDNHRSAEQARKPHGCQGSERKQAVGDHVRPDGLKTRQPTAARGNYMVSAQRFKDTLPHGRREVAGWPEGQDGYGQDG